ncbi:MAG: hypothetical protein GVY19_02185 [Bacteroidetes bacterium]|nr:hypothetical protein [Bacteroidota bacterium]
MSKVILIYSNKRSIGGILVIIRILILGLVLTTSMQAQQFGYRIQYDGFADNREYFNEYIEPQTIFGSRLSADIGIRFDSIHRVHAGFSQLYEFGGKESIPYPDITMYYAIDHELFEFYIGAFPRYNLVKHPRVLLTDTLLYFRPNVEGAYLEFRRKWGYQNFWIDWLSRQTNVHNEVFLAGHSGLVKAGRWFVNHHIIMQHLAGKAIPEEDFHLRDNGGLTAQLGYNFTSVAKSIRLDTLSLSVGGTMSYDRQRGLDNGLKYRSGILANLELDYKGYGISGRYYKGDGQTQVIGDWMYRAKRYFRIDTYITPIKGKHVRGSFKFSFHILPEVLDVSQQFYLKVNLGGAFR